METRSWWKSPVNTVVDVGKKIGDAVKDKAEDKFDKGKNLAGSIGKIVSEPLDPDTYVGIGQSTINFYNPISDSPTNSIGGASSSPISNSPITLELRNWVRTLLNTTLSPIVGLFNSLEEAVEVIVKIVTILPFISLGGIIISVLRMVPAPRPANK